MTTEQTETSYKPKYNISETDENLQLAIALPGVKKEQVELSSESNILKISAKRGNDVPEAWSRISVSEAPTQYELNVRVADEYDISLTEAKFDKNVLRLTVPARIKKQFSLKIE